MSYRFPVARKRVDPMRTLAPASRSAFHESVRSGDIGTLRQMLESEPLLAQARNRDRETPLFIAAVHPESSKAVEIIDILMEKGAVLGSRDLHKRHVSLYASHNGVDWEVVKCLMKWNAVKGGGILKWSQCDEEVRSSLVLACGGGHTQLALRLLDEIDVEEYAMQNHLFRVLEAAIGTSDESHAMAIGEHPKVEAGIRARDIYRYKGYRGPFLKHTVSTCTEAAVRRGMSTVVLLLNSLNHRKVCKAVWHFTQKQLKEGEDVHPVIVGIADEFLRDWRWAQVKIFFLLHFRGQDSDMATPKLQSHLLTRLPDGLFCLAIDFLNSRCFRDTAMKPLSLSLIGLFLMCECVENTLCDCPWHMYSPNENDYEKQRSCREIAQGFC